jgi:bifunctional UDP-N-acetylglucosamine pyrophosphorylase / glucosamine-1-phosphate N-acetyltransferase
MTAHAELHVVILAAGQGTRMRSALPKVLHPVGGTPMLGHVLAAAAEAGAAHCHLVYGHGGDQVRAWLAGSGLTLNLRWAQQAEQLGTGHAVNCAAPAVPDEAILLVAYGDVPLIRAETLQALAAAAQDALAIVTVELAQPRGYGRILRDAEGRVRGIVEEADASEAERAIHEINTGLMAAPARYFKPWLQRLRNDNRKGEYYLTDLVGFAVADGLPVRSVTAERSEEVEGVNDRAQLARAERVFQARQAEALMRAGVALADPARFDLRGRVEAGRDVFLDVGCVLEGRVVLGDGVRVGPYCLLRDVELGAGSVIESHSVLDGVRADEGVHVGPFARLRPGTVLARGAKVGNFVETKKTTVGEGSKINHLSYVGDATLGREVNVGAGTITCNYDGVNKHATVIDDGAFIGSNSALVAPVRIGAQATIGAGSVITKDAPEGQLTVARGKQLSLPSWQRPQKKS